MNDATMQAALSALRSILIAVGGILTARGVISEGQWQEIIGVVLMVVPLAWGVWQKFRAEAEAKARETVAVNVGISVADSTVGKTPPVSATEAPGLIARVAPK